VQRRKRAPGAGCDLCGRRAPLHRVVLAHARVAYVCDAHDDPSGEPVRKPSVTVKPVTSRLNPQRETLL